MSRIGKFNNSNLKRDNKTLFFPFRFLGGWNYIPRFFIIIVFIIRIKTESPGWLKATGDLTEQTGLLTFLINVKDLYNDCKPHF
jgi:hypothetical protein